VADRLIGVRAKIERAEFQRAALDAECKAWTEQQRAEVVHHYDSDTTWHRFVVKAIDPVPPPLVWSVVLGEIVHDLRSALDHTIWQLVLSNNCVPDKGNQFPIFSRYPKQPGAMNTCLNGVATAPATRIKQLQPYRRKNRKEPDPLEILGYLSNTDKHRTIHAVAAVTSSLVNTGDFTLTTGPGPNPVPEFRWNQSVGKPIEDEPELVAVRITPHEGASVEYKGHAQMGASIAFGEGGRVPFSKVANLVAEVTRIVAILEPFTA
jgi:hypothetical protein